MICYRNVCGVTPAHNEFLGEIFVKPKVYFTKTVTPEKVIEMYKQLDCKLPGNVAIKVHSGDYFGGLAQVYLFAVIGAVPTIIAMAKGAKHMVTTAKMRSAYAPVSAPAAASVQMSVQPASSPTAPQNVEKDIEK